MRPLLSWVCWAGYCRGKCQTACDQHQVALHSSGWLKVMATGALACPPAQAGSQVLMAAVPSPMAML